MTSNFSDWAHVVERDVIARQAVEDEQFKAWFREVALLSSAELALMGGSMHESSSVSQYVYNVLVTSNRKQETTRRLAVAFRNRTPATKVAEEVIHTTKYLSMLYMIIAGTYDELLTC